MESYSASQTEADAVLDSWYHSGKQETGEEAEVSLVLNADCIRLGRFALAMFYMKMCYSQLITNI